MISLSSELKAWLGELSREDRARIFEPLAHEINALPRSQRLAALRLRSKWRKADIKRLKAIGIRAEYRFRKLKLKTQRGRGVIAPRDFFAILHDALSLDVPARNRREALKRTSVWPQLVEAAYRGELESEREKSALAGKRNALLRYDGFRSKNAAKTVAKAIANSVSGVENLCIEARRHYRSGQPPSRAIRASDLAALLNLGQLPDSS